MKKYMIAALTLLLFAGVTQAQVEQKKPAEPNKQVVTQKKSNVAKKSTSPTVAQKKDMAGNTAIKRKHHHAKKTMHAKKAAKQ